MQRLHSNLLRKYEILDLGYNQVSFQNQIKKTKYIIRKFSRYFNIYTLNLDYYQIKR